MTRAINNNSGKVYKNFDTVKKTPSLNIEKSNACLECGKGFTKGLLNGCPAKEVLCNICKYKRHFGRLCESKGRRAVVNNVEEKSK